MVNDHSDSKIRKEGNVLFNDALNTFIIYVIWRRTYGKVPPYLNVLCYTSRGALAGMRNIEKENLLLLLHGLLFQNGSKDSFTCTIPQTVSTLFRDVYLKVKVVYGPISSMVSLRSIPVSYPHGLYLTEK